MKAIMTDILMAAGLALSLLLSSFTGFAQECEELQGEVLRLHIPANSDSEYDQQLKLQVRDLVLEQYGTQLAEAKDLYAAEQLTAMLLPEIEQTCNAFLSQQGADYTATAQLCEMYFSTREYEDVTLPAGTYTALRITLGSGEGNNWWCVMFPPLCIPMAAERCEADAIIPDELLNTDNNSNIEIKLAIFELFKKLMGKDR